MASTRTKSQPAVEPTDRIEPFGDRIHRPGSMLGAQRPLGMAAAWMVWIEITPNPFWSAALQHRHRQTAYNGSVAAGIVWC